MFLSPANLDAASTRKIQQHPPFDREARYDLVSMIPTKRIYEAPHEDDGFRVLIDRLWPRGLTREKARVDLWARDLAPSAELRKWFGHQPERWSEFKRRYFEELDRHTEAVAELRSQIGKQKATLLYAAKDLDYNNAVCFAEYLALR